MKIVRNDESRRTATIIQKITLPITVNASAKTGAPVPDRIDDIKQAPSLCDLKAIVNRRPSRHKNLAHKGVALADHRRVHNPTFHYRAGRTVLLGHNGSAVDPPDEKHLARFGHVIANLLGDKRAVRKKQGGMCKAIAQ